MDPNGRMMNFWSRWWIFVRYINRFWFLIRIIGIIVVIISLRLLVMDNRGYVMNFWSRCWGRLRIDSGGHWRRLERDRCPQTAVAEPAVALGQAGGVLTSWLSLLAWSSWRPSSVSRRCSRRRSPARRLPLRIITMPRNSKNAEPAPIKKIVEEVADIDKPENSKAAAPEPPSTPAAITMPARMMSKRPAMTMVSPSLSWLRPDKWNSA